MFTKEESSKVLSHLVFTRSKLIEAGRSIESDLEAVLSRPVRDLPPELEQVTMLLHQAIGVLDQFTVELTRTILEGL